jgi:hypothetical protein
MLWSYFEQQEVLDFHLRSYPAIDREVDLVDEGEELKVDMPAMDIL